MNTVIPVDDRRALIVSEANAFIAKHKLNVTALAKSVFEVSQSTLSDVLRGKRNITDKLYAKLVNFIDTFDESKSVLKKSTNYASEERIKITQQIKDLARERKFSFARVSKYLGIGNTVLTTPHAYIPEHCLEVAKELLAQVEESGIVGLEHLLLKQGGKTKKYESGLSDDFALEDDPWASGRLSKQITENTFNPNYEWTFES